MSIESIRSLIAPDMLAVDDVIRRNLYSDVALVRQIGEYIIGAGGKRLRPVLVLLSAGAFDYKGSAHHDLAAVVEFIHTATLLHDDVVDESDLRRGRKTANAMFGNAASVLVGDFLYSRAFQMMVKVGSMRVQEVLAEATNVIAEGEVLQLMNIHNADIDEADYMQVIQYKTAKLFEAAARLGAILGNASAQQESAMAEYGMLLGTAFQIVDDVLDYTGDATAIGKNLGDDLAEGKPTLPLIYTMQRGTPEQSALARQVIEQGGLEAFDEIVAAVRACGALEAAMDTANRIKQQAIDRLGALPPSQFKNTLLELALFAVDRKS
ncbi:MAG: octaprenyl diphosphate synthase [Burkholderiales bacterium]